MNNRQSNASVQEVTSGLTAIGSPFEMCSIEVRGKKLRGWKHAPATLADVLAASAGFGVREFLHYDSEAEGACAGEFDRLDYETHFGLAATLSHRLIDSFGVSPGDRVAIAMRNLPEWSVAFWATVSAGAIVVPLNAWGTGPELTYGLQDSGARVVIADGERANRISIHAQELPDLRHVIVARATDDVPSNVIAFEDAIGSIEKNVKLPDVAIDTDDHATIFYTSGTTGRPKGALGTHRNICTNIISRNFCITRAAARAKGVDDALSEAKQQKPNGVYLLSVPLFHATGCHSLLVTNMSAGNKIVLMHRWAADRALELIEQEGVTAFGGVPLVASQILDHPMLDRYDLSSVQSISFGGAPAPPQLASRLASTFPGRSASNGYGLTEASAVVAMNIGLDYRARPESVGVPVPVCDIRVTGNDGSDFSLGNTGELLISGPNIVDGYWNQPAATNDTIIDGWLHTGDIARVDGDGFIYIVDRAKDMIIRGGENIYCVEIEGAMFEHPAVREAAVFGVAHETLGEEVGAVVYSDPASDLDADSLREFLAPNLAAFKLPTHIWFSDDPLPRNPNGKVLKHDLRSRVADQP